MGLFNALFGLKQDSSSGKDTYTAVTVSDTQRTVVEQFCKRLIRDFFPGVFDMDWDLFRCRYISEPWQNQCLVAYMAATYRMCEALFDAYVNSGLIVAENLYPDGNELGAIFEERRTQVIKNFGTYENFKKLYFGLLRPELSRLANKRYVEMPEAFERFKSFCGLNAPRFGMSTVKEYWESVRQAEIFIVRYIYSTFTKPSDNAPSTVAEWQSWVKKWSETDGEYGIGQTFTYAMFTYFSVVRCQVSGYET